ncbi:hypothetical protein FRB90_002162 [Tulasnella sp. 427]|nr:hypothetical protein FRB90_002162 [Tulasnella sp. 427]
MTTPKNLNRSLPLSPGGASTAFRNAPLESAVPASSRLSLCQTSAVIPETFDLQRSGGGMPDQNIAFTGPGGQWLAASSARKIDDLGAMNYPTGINPPSTLLHNGRSAGAKYTYDRSFLLQFLPLLKDKPKWASRLDGYGVERPAKSADNSRLGPGGAGVPNRLKNPRSSKKARTGAGDPSASWDRQLHSKEGPKKSSGAPGSNAGESPRDAQPDTKEVARSAGEEVGSSAAASDTKESTQATQFDTKDANVPTTRARSLGLPAKRMMEFLLTRFERPSPASSQQQISTPKKAKQKAVKSGPVGQKN